jgi:hypothetical protein
MGIRNVKSRNRRILKQIHIAKTSAITVQLVLLAIFPSIIWSAMGTSHVSAESHGVSAAPMSAAIVTVPANYSTIQLARNNAGADYTVFVRSGTYFGGIVLNKSISLVGAEAESTVIDGNMTGNTVHVTSNNV